MFADIHPQAESLSYDHPLIRNKQLLNHQTQIMIQRLGLIQRRVSPAAPLTRHDPQAFAAGPAACALPLSFGSSFDG